MTRRKEYPGFLLYFDRMEGLISELPDEELGMVLRAMYHYARFGTEPEELPRELRFFWPTLRKMLDDDRAAYEDKCRAGAYSATCQAAKQRGEKAPDREEYYKRYDAAKAEEAYGRQQAEKAATALKQTEEQREPFFRHPDDQQESILRDEAMKKLEEYCRNNGGTLL